MTDAPPPFCSDALLSGGVWVGGRVEGRRGVVLLEVLLEELLEQGLVSGRRGDFHVGLGTRI
jgi:hypothetical protein